jgi:hypothetical protein
LFLNCRDGTYAEIAQLAGLQASEWSWCPIFLDVDLDRDEDLLITTGHAFDSQDADADEQVARDARAGAERGRQHPEISALECAESGVPKSR